jgi:hypothetical protein
MNGNSAAVGLSVLVGASVALALEPSLNGTESALAGFLASLVTLMLSGLVQRPVLRT